MLILYKSMQIKNIQFLKNISLLGKQIFNDGGKFSLRLLYLCLRIKCLSQYSNIFLKCFYFFLTWLYCVNLNFLELYKQAIINEKGSLITFVGALTTLLDLKLGVLREISMLLRMRQPRKKCGETSKYIEALSWGRGGVLIVDEFDVEHGFEI